MKHRLLYTLGLIVLTMFVLTTIPAQAQTTANGPYYATPSWDQTLACTTTANCPRLIVLSNMSSAAVLDRETGLVWERSPSTSTFDWQNLHFHCNTLAVGNRRGWRGPTFQELASLYDQSAPSPGPALPPGHPFSNVQSGHYWSATTLSSDVPTTGPFAWIVDFGVPGGVGIGPKFTLNYLWCVRGGQGVDPQ